MNPSRNTQVYTTKDQDFRLKSTIQTIAYYEQRAARAGDPSATRFFLQKIIQINETLYHDERCDRNTNKHAWSRIDLHAGRAHLDLANTHLESTPDGPYQGRLYLDQEPTTLNPERRIETLQKARRAFQAARRKDPENPDPLIGLSLASARMARLIEQPYRKSFLLLESIAAGAKAEESINTARKEGKPEETSIFPENARGILQKHIAETVLRYGKFLSYRADKEIYHLQDHLMRHEGWEFNYPPQYSFLFDAKKYCISEKADLLYRTFLLAREGFKEAEQNSPARGNDSLERRIMALDCGIQIGRFSHELDKPREGQQKLEETINNLLKLKRTEALKNPQHKETVAFLLGDAHLRLSQIQADNPEACARYVIEALKHLQTAKEMYHKTAILTDERDPGTALMRQLEYQAKAYQFLGEALTQIEHIGIGLRKKIRKLFSQDKVIRPPGSAKIPDRMIEKESLLYAKEAFCSSIEATRIAHDVNGDDPRSRHYLGLSHMWLARANYIEFMRRKDELQSRMMSPLFLDSPRSRLQAISRMNTNKIENNLNPSEKDKWLETALFEETTRIALSRSFSPGSIAADISYFIAEIVYLEKKIRPDHDALQKLGQKIYDYASEIREGAEKGSAQAIMNLNPDPRWTYIMSLIKETFHLKGSRTAGKVRELLIDISLDPRGLFPEEAYWRIRKEIDKEMPTNTHRLLQIEIISDLEKAIFYLDRSVESDPTYLRPAYEKMRIPHHISIKEINFPTIDSQLPESKLTIKSPERFEEHALIKEFKERRKLSGKEPVFYHLGKGIGGWVKSKYGFLPLFEKEMTPSEAKLIKKLYPNIMIDYEPYPDTRGMGIALLHDGGKDMQRQICTLIGEIQTLNMFLRDGIGDPRAIRKELSRKTNRRMSMFMTSAKDIPKTCKAILEAIDTGGAQEKPYQCDKSAAHHVREALRTTSLPERLDTDGKRRDYKIKTQRQNERKELPIFTLKGEPLHVRLFQTPDDYIRRMQDSLIPYSTFHFPNHPRTGLLRFLIHYTKHIAIPCAQRNKTIYFDAKPPNKLAYGFCDLNSLKWTHVEENWASYLCSEGVEMPGFRTRPNFRPHEMKKLISALYKATRMEFPNYNVTLDDVLTNWHSIEAGKALTLLGHEFKQQVKEIDERLKPEQKGYWMRKSEKAAKYYKNLIINTLEQATRNELIPQDRRRSITRFLRFMNEMRIEPNFCRENP